MFFKKTAQRDIEQGLKALFPRLWRYCLVLTSNRERANDLAQSACLRALEKAAQFEPGTNLDRWVFRIAQRIWLNELRSESVRQGGGMASIDEIDLPDTKPDPESNLLAREVLLKVMTLPEAQRATVMLVYVEGYSYKEAADVLEIPVGTIMSRLSAARAKLAVKLRPKESNAG